MLLTRNFCTKITCVFSKISWASRKL